MSALIERLLVESNAWRSLLEEVVKLPEDMLERLDEFKSDYPELYEMGKAWLKRHAHSESAVMRERGADLAKGFAQGIVDHTIGNVKASNMTVNAPTGASARDRQTEVWMRPEGEENWTPLGVTDDSQITFTYDEGEPAAFITGQMWDKTVKDVWWNTKVLNPLYGPERDIVQHFVDASGGKEWLLGPSEEAEQERTIVSTLAASIIKARPKAEHYIGTPETMEPYDLGDSKITVIRDTSVLPDAEELGKVTIYPTQGKGWKVTSQDLLSNLQDWGEFTILCKGEVWRDVLASLSTRT